MTRQFNSRIRCQHCSGITTEESPMERWVRNHPQLSSSNGVVRFDVDILLHRFKIASDLKGDREIELMMFIEVKTFGADLTQSQRDTLGLLDQALRNRRQNKWRTPRRQSSIQASSFYSNLKRRDVKLRLLGGHLLQLSGVDPVQSDWMKWDYKPINIETLVELMLFDRDPDNLNAKKEDWLRRRSQPFRRMPKQPHLFPDLSPHDHID